LAAGTDAIEEKISNKRVDGDPKDPPKHIEIFEMISICGSRSIVLVEERGMQTDAKANECAKLLQDNRRNLSSERRKKGEH